MPGAGAQRESASAALGGQTPTPALSAGPVLAAATRHHPGGPGPGPGVIPAADCAASLQLQQSAGRAAPGEGALPWPAPQPAAHAHHHLLGAGHLPAVLRPLSHQPAGIHADARGAAAALRPGQGDQGCAPRGVIASQLQLLPQPSRLLFLQQPGAQGGARQPVTERLFLYHYLKVSTRLVSLSLSQGLHTPLYNKFHTIDKDFVYEYTVSHKPLLSVNRVSVFLPGVCWLVYFSAPVWGSVPCTLSLNHLFSIICPYVFVKYLNAIFFIQSEC